MEYFYVYMLRCSDGSFYVGQTDDLVRRFAEHADGKGGLYTAQRLPVKLVFSQEFITREEAFIAEQKIKRWSRTKKEALCKKSWQEIELLAKKHLSTSSLRPCSLRARQQGHCLEDRQDDRFRATGGGCGRLRSTAHPECLPKLSGGRCIEGARWRATQWKTSSFKTLLFQ